MQSLRSGRARKQMALPDEQEDAPILQLLEDAQEESGLTPGQFRRKYPCVGLYHADFEGRTVIDRRQIDGHAT